MSASPWAALLNPPIRRTTFNRLAPTLIKPTKIEWVRALLRTQGPLTAQQICLEVDYPHTSLVSASLKGDLAKGRIELRNGRYHYNHQFDDQLADELAQAAELLRRHGYEVRRKS